MEECIGGLRHLYMTVFLSGFASLMVIPAITDITMLALCPGQDECSLAIYLSGFQQAIIGLGTVVMTPLIGNLSDVYGRKSLLTVPLALSIIPLVILAYSRETNFFYAYFALRTVTAMVCEGSINCLTLAYVADTVPERERVPAFGILAGFLSASFVCGTLAARFLSTASTFQVAAFASMLATIYMRVFLKESLPGRDGTLRQPILKGGSDAIEEDGYSPETIEVFKKVPSAGDLICLLRSSKTLSQAAIVSFFQSLAEGGLQASLMYFLKARFHFNKNQFADLMLIVGISGTVSQLLFMPMLAPVIGEEKLLSIGLLVGSFNMFLNSISWAVWVPYAATLFSAFGFLVQPSIRSIASKQVGPNEQGKAQGCISGISSFANIVSPLIFSPLTALFLSEEAPFYFPGFSIMCIGLAMIIAFVQSTMIRASPISSHKISSIISVDST
ncbi:PREDICTED: hippocampus abundant [Prunus dulcis]|uniref:PREDICTED: hippocampus abundant n=1 Tax=Prunus dulcis TaxID=3755 RepID=A0A5E4EPD2_PRUDU|nr:hippocampus abundant transcript-like protein 1 [Prunus dulcis]VVA15728.1 PREDICTED: hippocampus abundant [Prunus dulcis]